eukprot:TRINITY_DN36493_c0_g2_i1.p2 TRINITY_DN36493_c0_g2~~TRINITY_DN36493_c0_g2_i1.p2  ORF type:complete len:236 (+),score=62.85 TRINITY_DN36493_c0_g2_i1:190-897(+)
MCIRDRSTQSTWDKLNFNMQSIQNRSKLINVEFNYQKVKPQQNYITLSQLDKFSQNSQKNSLKSSQQQQQCDDSKSQIQYTSANNKEQEIQDQVQINQPLESQVKEEKQSDKKQSKESPVIHQEQQQNSDIKEISSLTNSQQQKLYQLISLSEKVKQEYALQQQQLQQREQISKQEQNQEQNQKEIIEQINTNIIKPFDLIQPNYEKQPSNDQSNTSIKDISHQYDSVQFKNEQQ